MSKKNAIVFSIALLIVFLDQLTKILIKKNFQLSESIPIIKNILHLTYVTNTGSAFGLFKGLNLFFMLFSVIVTVVIFYYLKKKIKENEILLQLAVGLLLGGTLGNFIDRLAYGHVTDFIDFRVWPVFNIADSAVTISVVLLIVLLWRK
ncbi:signal peptidase II [Candidatus Woesearchaeota archaeon]|nr:signal peptidase II [Candidatus Woesearchaeota archaeon]